MRPCEREADSDGEASVVEAGNFQGTSLHICL